MAAIQIEDVFGLLSGLQNSRKMRFLVSSFPARCQCHMHEDLKKSSKGNPPPWSLSQRGQRLVCSLPCCRSSAATEIFSLCPSTFTQRAPPIPKTGRILRIPRFADQVLPPFHSRLPTPTANTAQSLPSDAAAQCPALPCPALPTGICTLRASHAVEYHSAASS